MAYESGTINPGDLVLTGTRHQVKLEVEATFHPLGAPRSMVNVAERTTPQRVYPRPSDHRPVRDWIEKDQVCYIRQSPENQAKIAEANRSLKADIAEIQRKLLDAFGVCEAAAAERVRKHNETVKALMDGEPYVFDHRGEPGKPSEPFDNHEITLGHIRLLEDIQKEGGLRRWVDITHAPRDEDAGMHWRIRDMVYCGLLEFATDQEGARTVILTETGEKAATEGGAAIHWLGDLKLIQNYREREAWDGLDPA